MSKKKDKKIRKSPRKYNVIVETDMAKKDLHLEENNEDNSNTEIEDYQDLIQSIINHDWDLCHSLISLSESSDGIYSVALHYLICNSAEITSSTQLSQLVSELIDAGADVHADNDKLLLDALHQASPEIVLMLLDAGVDPDAKYDGKSCLWYIIHQRHSIMNDPSFRNDMAKFSIFMRYGAIAVTLLEHGAHVDKEMIELAAGDKFLFDRLYDTLILQLKRELLKGIDEEQEVDSFDSWF